MVGRWHVKDDGHRDPSVRTLLRPILNLFHGEQNCKKWVWDRCCVKQRVLSPALREVVRKCVREGLCPALREAVRKCVK